MAPFLALVLLAGVTPSATAPTHPTPIQAEISAPPGFALRPSHPELGLYFLEWIINNHARPSQPEIWHYLLEWLTNNQPTSSPR